MGVDEIKKKISDHILWAGELASQIKKTRGFRLYEPQNLALVCFSLSPEKETGKDELNTSNMNFLHQLNSSGKIYLSHTKVNGEVFLRMQIGQTTVTREHVQKAWDFIKNESVQYLK